MKNIKQLLTENHGGKHILFMGKTPLTRKKPDGLLDYQSEECFKMLSANLVEFILKPLSELGYQDIEVTGEQGINQTLAIAVKKTGILNTCFVLPSKDFGSKWAVDGLFGKLYFNQKFIPAIDKLNTSTPLLTTNIIEINHNDYVKVGQTDLLVVMYEDDSWIYSNNRIAKCIRYAKQTNTPVLQITYNPDKINRANLADMDKFDIHYMPNRPEPKKETTAGIVSYIPAPITELSTQNKSVKLIPTTHLE